MSGVNKITWAIRPMEHEDVNTCLDIWSQVGLVEGHLTVSSALSADPDGFYVAESRETREILGMCVATVTRTDTAFIGFYAVKPKYQGMGIGRELWSTSLSRFEPSINVGLYGIPNMAAKYKKAGFWVEDSIRMLIHESKPKQQIKLDHLKDISELAGCRLELVDRSTSETLFQKLIEYDKTVQQFSREKLLRLYLKGDQVPLTVMVVKDRNILLPNEQESFCRAKTIQEDEGLSKKVETTLSISSCCSNTSTEPQTAQSQEADEISEILGYGCIRCDNKSSAMIGPLYAESSDLCEVILRSLITRFKLGPDSIISAMTLTSNKEASEILGKVGLYETEECSRMFTKFVPSASFSKIFYVHSPNFTLF